MELSHGLTKMCQMPCNELRQRGELGCELGLKKFTLEQVGVMLMDMYKKSV